MYCHTEQHVFVVGIQSDKHFHLHLQTVMFHNKVFTYLNMLLTVEKPQIHLVY